MDEEIIIIEGKRYKRRKDGSLYGLDFMEALERCAKEDEGKAWIEKQ